MRRFAILAVLSAVFTIIFGYEAVVAIVQGIEGLTGVGGVRIVGAGALRVATGLLCAYLAWLTGRLARQQFLLSRVMRK